jgi:hypothetical protein
VETGAAAVPWARRRFVGGGVSVPDGDGRPSTPALDADHLAGGPWPTKTRRPVIKWAGPISTVKKILFQLFQTTSSLQNMKVVPPAPQIFFQLYQGVETFRRNNFSFGKKFKFPTNIELKI